MKAMCFFKLFVSKVGDINIKRNMSLFSLHSPYLALLSLSFFFYIALSVFKAFRSREIKVHMGDLVESINLVFINPVINVINH